MEPFLTQIATAVAETLGCDAQKVRSSVQASGNPERGDLSLPCFPLAAATGNPGKDGAMAVADMVQGGTMTSSPGPMPMAPMAA